MRAETEARGATVLVTAVGAAAGSRVAAAALACAGSQVDAAALLIDLAAGRAPRPSLVATAAARRLEERLASHLPDVPVASRGRFCHLALPPEPDGIERVAAAQPLVRDSLAVVHLPPRMLQPVLDEPSIRPTAALLRADLPADRALTALTARDLIDRGLRVAVLKRPLGWLVARAALLGALPDGSAALPGRMTERLLRTADNKLPHCYDRRDELEGERQEADREQAYRQEPQGSGARESASEGRG